MKVKSWRQGERSRSLCWSDSLMMLGRTTPFNCGNNSTPQPVRSYCFITFVEFYLLVISSFCFINIVVYVGSNAINIDKMYEYEIVSCILLLLYCVLQVKWWGVSTISTTHLSSLCTHWHSQLHFMTLCQITNCGHHGNTSSTSCSWRRTRWVQDEDSGGLTVTFSLQPQSCDQTDSNQTL